MWYVVTISENKMQQILLKFHVQEDLQKQKGRL
jgi:hypothetical protein